METLIKKKKPNLLKSTIKLNKLNNLYTPPYESSWFETENKVSLDTYIKHLFLLSKLQSLV